MSVKLFIEDSNEEESGENDDEINDDDDEWVDTDSDDDNCATEISEPNDPKFQPEADTIVKDKLQNVQVVDISDLSKNSASKVIADSNCSEQEVTTVGRQKGGEICNDARIQSGEELIDLFKSLLGRVGADNSELTTVGLVWLLCL